MGREVSVEELAQRARYQSHGHWLEFASIVAGGNLVLALLAAGALVTAVTQDALPVWYICLAAVMLAASGLAVILAYYSLQLAAVFIWGPLRLSQTLVSFLIAGAQVSLFLWLGYALRTAAPNGPKVLLASLRHWLLFIGLFALAAATANLIAGLDRKRMAFERSAYLDEFDAAQRGDFRGSSLSGGALLIIWIVLLRWPSLLLLGLGVTGALFAMSEGLRSQMKQARIVWRLIDTPQGR